MDFLEIHHQIITGIFLVPVRKKTDGSDGLEFLLLGIYLTLNSLIKFSKNLYYLSNLIRVHLIGITLVFTQMCIDGSDTSSCYFFQIGSSEVLYKTSS